MPSRHHAVPASLLVALVLLGATGCGSSDDAAATASRSPSVNAPSAVKRSVPGTTLTVRVDGDQVTPRNRRVELQAGRPLTLRVVSDRRGELHVHSSPETTFDFGPGVSTKQVTIARPGLVDLEEHVSDTLVAQLEVR